MQSARVNTYTTRPNESPGSGERGFALLLVLVILMT